MINIDTDEGVRSWLAALGLGELAGNFAADGRRGARLLAITREDLADLGVPKGAKRGEIMLAIEALKTGDAPVILPDDKAPSYAPALTDTALVRCREIGQRPPEPWLDEVADTWPGAAPDHAPDAEPLRPAGALPGRSGRAARSRKQAEHRRFHSPVGGFA